MRRKLRCQIACRTKKPRSVQCAGWHKGATALGAQMRANIIETSVYGALFKGDAKALAALRTPGEIHPPPFVPGIEIPSLL